MGSKREVLVLRDEGDNYYVVPREMLQQLRLSEEKAAQARGLFAQAGSAAFVKMMQEPVRHLAGDAGVETYIKMLPPSMRQSPSASLFGMWGIEDDNFITGLGPVEPIAPS